MLRKGQVQLSFILDITNVHLGQEIFIPHVKVRKSKKKCFLISKFTWRTYQK